MDVVRKQPAGLPIRPNLIDCEAERAAFSWAAARRSLAGRIPTLYVALPQVAGIVAAARKVMSR